MYIGNLTENQKFSVIMFSTVEFRSVIRFMVLKKIKTNQIIQELQVVYQDHCPSQRFIYQWVAQFKHGRTSVHDEKSSGRPVEVSDDKKEKLKEIIQYDRKITTRQITAELNISKGTLHGFLKELGIRKLCSRFVPHFLTGEMCQRRLECCLANLALYEQIGEKFLRNIVTMDETPISLYLPESKRESKEWKFPDERPTRKLKSSLTHRKVLMLTVYWDWSGVLSVDYTDGSCNTDYYVGQMQTARKCRRKPRGEELWLLQDNAPCHTSNVAQTEILKVGFSLLRHPPYSPDLAPSDFYLFGHLKRHLRGQVFESKEEVKLAVDDFLQRQPQNFFKKAFDQLLARWKKCVDANGSYIEK